MRTHKQAWSRSRATPTPPAFASGTSPFYDAPITFFGGMPRGAGGELPVRRRLGSGLYRRHRPVHVSTPLRIAGGEPLELVTALSRRRSSTMRVRTRWVLLLSLLACAGCGKTKSTDELITDLKSSQDRDQTTAVRTLPRRKGDAAKVIPALIEALGDKSGGVRQGAAIGLGSFGEQAKAAVPALQSPARRPRRPRPQEPSASPCRHRPGSIPRPAQAAGPGVIALATRLAPRPASAITAPSRSSPESSCAPSLFALLPIALVLCAASAARRRPARPGALAGGRPRRGVFGRPQAQGTRTAIATAWTTRSARPTGPDRRSAAGAVRRTGAGPRRRLPVGQPRAAAPTGAPATQRLVRGDDGDPEPRDGRVVDPGRRGRRLRLPRRQPF